MPIAGKSRSIHCGKGPWSNLNGSVVNVWLYGPRWFCNPLIIPGVPTYNVAPYPSSVTIAPSPVIHETVFVPQTVVHRSPPRYSSSPPISRTTLVVKPQSHGHHSSRRVFFSGGHCSHSPSNKKNHGMLGRQ